MSKPNILFLFPDQHRYDWISSTPGLDLRTPNIDWLQARGTTFSKALCPSPLCAPARACIASGLEYRRISVITNGQNYPTDVRTIYTALQEVGYQVGGCGKFDLDKARSDWGLDGRRHIAEWGFTHGLDSAGKWDAVNSGHVSPADPYMKYLHDHGLAKIHAEDLWTRKDPLASHATPLPEHAYTDNWTGQRGLEILQEFERGKPWFLQVNFPGPHNPWDITERMKDSVEGRDCPAAVDSRIEDQEALQEVRRNYTASVENIDRWIGIYLDHLREAGQLDNTLIIFSSDHGEMLGDHDKWGKSMPYQPSIGVPMIAVPPGGMAAATHDGPAINLDVTATFADYAGAELPNIDSISLRPVLEGKGGGRETVRCGLKDWQVAFDGRYKLVHNWHDADQEYELYDVESDPHDLSPIDNQPVLERLKAQLYPEDRQF